MTDLLILLRSFLASLFKLRIRLEAEIPSLRHQINILRRRVPKRISRTNFDRLILMSLYRLVPSTLEALVIIRPETVIWLHRLGFRAYWRWKSRRRGWRPKAPLEVRQLIQQLSLRTLGICSSGN